MNIGQLLFAVASMLLITLVAIGLARRLNLGSIVALLLVGILLGPSSPWPLFTAHLEEMRAVGEVGVMLLLFAIGLDIQPTKLWSMRRMVFGLGSVQYALTVAAILAFFLVTGLVAGTHWRTALVVALALSLSSAAIPLPILKERRDEATKHGRAALAIEIFQSLLIVPVLALIALLGPGPTPSPHEIDPWKSAQVVAVLGGIFLAARYLLPMALGITARALGPIAFTLMALAAVFFAGWAMEAIGISMALGAFIVGVLLSTSLYAEQMKASIAPARQILLALFFIAIGMAIDVRQLAGLAGELVLYLPALLLIKFAILLVLARLFGMQRRSAILTGVLMMPFDEFAYVILASANAHHLLSPAGYTLGLSIISLSFIVSPILINLAYRLSDRMSGRRPLPHALPAVDGRVVILGGGDVSRAICTMLERAAVAYVAFDLSLQDIERARNAGHNAVYGDLADPVMMDAIGIGDARLVISATSDFEATRRMLEGLRQFYPHVPIMAAVRYLAQRDELRLTGVTQVIALMPEGTLNFGLRILDRLGVRDEQAAAIVAAIQASDYAALRSAQLIAQV